MRRSTMRRSTMRRWTLATAAALTALTLAGCGGQEAVGSAPIAAEGAPAGVPMEAAPASDRVGSTPIAPQVITTAWLTLRVPSVSDGVDTIVDLVAARQGMVQQQDVTSTDGTQTAMVVARIPADDLDGFLDAVGALGTIESVSRQATDVTQQRIDLDARIGALSASIDRLRELQAQAGSVADLVAVETELAARQGELDGLTAQRDYLADQVAMSTVTMTILPTVQAGGWQAPGFIPGLQNGIAALVALVGVAITTLGFLVPFLAVLAIIAIPIAWLLVRRSRRRG